MNTIENNKLIAEFLGQTKMPYEFPQFGYINTNGDWDDTFFDNQLKFHSNWNWLMKVVNKIDKLELNGKTYAVDIYQSGCQIFEYGNYNNEIITTISDTRLEATYKAVVEFIKLKL